jgi:succinate dehydrogenase / fumarate reductase cytochrome b subunit
VATTQVPARSRRLPWPVEFYRSAVGKKWVMAITGLMLLGFVLAHMIGNLKAYIGFDAIEGAYELDIYGEALRTLLFPLLPRTAALWILRVGLIGAFALHIHSAYSLTIMNRKARPTGYQGPRNYLAANYASRTMRWSGIIVLLYLAWHLADFTWGVQPFAPEGWEHGAVQANFVGSLSRLPVAVLYIVANLALGVHIFHGAWSMFQSLGVNNPRFNAWRRYFAIGFAGLIVAGNVSLPLAVLTGVVDMTR